MKPNPILEAELRRDIQALPVTALVKARLNAFSIKRSLVPRVFIHLINNRINGRVSVNRALIASNLKTQTVGVKKALHALEDCGLIIKRNSSIPHAPATYFRFCRKFC